MQTQTRGLRDVDDTDMYVLPDDGDARTDFVLIVLGLEVLEVLFEEKHTLAPRVGGWGTIRICLRGRDGE